MENMKNAMVNDVEVKEEKAMENQNVAAQENHEGKVKRFCTECGSIIWVEPKSRVTTCDSCREAKKKAQALKVHEQAKLRKEKLGLVTMSVSLHESTRDLLKSKAKAKGMNIADFLKELLEEPAKQENEIA